ncbi:hypothetical protein [Paenibacillus sp. FSL L8-0494]|uniref:hypothetical protein n=1 Tax=Paenibacillus sp. FSL L8-0494 TaxID=2975352 RepID=UPI00096D02B5|nr:hypothetical protein BJP48_28440 [Paenibacillus odorifer]
MVDKIQVSAFLKYLGEGVSQPALVLSDENERYILKNQKTMIDGKSVDLNCTFLNEILAYQIALFLDVPVPKSAIADVNQVLLDNGPSLRFVHRFSEGEFFASKEVLDKEENLLENYGILRQMGKPYINRSWNRYFSNICNPEDAPKIIALDLLISNVDRYNNTGNLLVANIPEGRKMFCIDHGHAFYGAVWDVNKMSRLKNTFVSQESLDSYLGYLKYFPAAAGQMNGLGEVFKAIEVNCNLDQIDFHSFQQVVLKIESIQESHLDEWLGNVPDAWFVDKNNQIGLYKHFLMNQKELMRFVIQSMANANAFTNFRGGQLQWKDRLAGTV